MQHYHFNCFIKMFNLMNLLHFLALKFCYLKELQKKYFTSSAMKQFLVLPFLLIFVECQSINGVNLVLIKANNQPIKLIWGEISTLLTSPDYSRDKKSVVFIYGWNDNLTSECTNRIIEAYATRRSEYNIFILDWSTFSTQMYLRAVADIDRVDFFYLKYLKKLP